MQGKALHIGGLGVLVVLIAMVCILMPTSLNQNPVAAQGPQGGGVSVGATSDTITVTYSGHATFNQVKPTGRIQSRHQDYAWYERITVAVPSCVTISKGCLSTPADGSSDNFKVVGTPILTVSGSLSQRAPSWQTAQVHSEVDCAANASALPTMQSTANPNPYAVKTTASADFPIKVRFALHEIWVYAVAPGGWTHWKVTSGCTSLPVQDFVGGTGFSPVTWRYEPVGDLDKVLPYAKTDNVSPVPGASGTATFRVAGGAPGTYVALGDSYSSGEFPPFAGEDLSCLQSTGAYPMIYDPDTALFLACSGATSSGVMTQQVPQIPHDAKIISITVGGDDIPVGTVVIECIKYRILDKLTNFGMGDPCFLHQGIDLATAVPQIQPDLVKLFTAIHEQAKGARIYVLGYPDPIPSGFKAGSCPALESATRGGFTIPGTGIDSHDASFLHNLGSAINSRIQAAAHDSGVVQYVEPFVGHDLCSSSPWFYPLSAGLPLALHPTATGQEEMAKELRGAAGPPP